MGRVKILTLAITANLLFFGTSLAQSSQEISSPPEVDLKSFPEEGHLYLDSKEVTSDVIFESLPKDDKEALLFLKEKDPNKFRKVIKEKLKKQKEYLKRLRREDPEKFNEIVRKAKKKIRKRLQRLREVNPEKFRELMRRRAFIRRKRLRELCRENPEKCKEVIARRREVLRKRLQELKQEDPQRYEKMKDRLRKLRERITHWGWERGKHRGWFNPRNPKRGIAPHHFGR
ncbi:MAG: hypothetical protein J7K71_00605 [Candidatus Omnitrophica bacterium]|nr:hypothetical protein [Candidatus Omnitrophota bacterium]